MLVTLPTRYHQFLGGIVGKPIGATWQPVQLQPFICSFMTYSVVLFCDQCIIGRNDSHMDA